MSNPDISPYVRRTYGDRLFQRYPSGLPTWFKHSPEEPQVVRPSVLIASVVHPALQSIMSIPSNQASVLPTRPLKHHAMDIVTEILDAIPESDQQVHLKRREALLLQQPTPTGPIKFWHDYPLLPVVHFDLNYTPRKFAPPRDIFASRVFRLEWQLMNGRQPFYHRNGDVEEISYQAAGERTLMTELGTVELRPGDFSRIPVGVAHDNYGREDVHILLYALAPATEAGTVVHTAEHKDVPFPGWKPANPSTNELLTECLGEPGCDIAVTQVDETLLLDPDNAYARTGQKLVVQRAFSNTSVTAAGTSTNGHAGDTNLSQDWLYKSTHVWIAMCRLLPPSKASSATRTYHRHRRAVVIHAQIKGRRKLISQRGTVELGPGDFIMIPRGCAYTSVDIGGDQECEYIAVYTTEDVELKAEVARWAVPTTVEAVQGVVG